MPACPSRLTTEDTVGLEIPVRVALGMTRRRLATQLFIESSILATLGGVGAVVVLVWGGGGGAGPAQIHAPTLILGGDSDFATSGYNGDFDRITEPVVFLIKSGTDHIACARNNLAPWTAFMRWHWYGEEAKYKADFLDGGIYCEGPWACGTKGF